MKGFAVVIKIVWTIFIWIQETDGAGRICHHTVPADMANRELCHKFPPNCDKVGIGGITFSQDGQWNSRDDGTSKSNAFGCSTPRLSTQPTTTIENPQCAPATVTSSEEETTESHACFWTEHVLGCIVGNNDWIVEALTIAECRQKCEDEREFSCLSIDYGNGFCTLSSVNRDSVQPRSDYEQPCYRPNFYYQERLNVASWSSEVTVCIKEHCSIRNTTVPNLESCRLICSQEPGCLSIYFKNGECYLNDSNRKNVIRSLDYLCSLSVYGYQYSEIAEHGSCNSE